MDFIIISEKIRAVCAYEIYLAFYDIFKGCKISDFNLLGFCDVFSVDIKIILCTI